LIVAKLKGNNLYDVYIFIDEDWKKSLNYTNIVWADDFSDKDNINMREFDFSNSKDGIYVDVIEDTAWKQYNPVEGGLMVGEVDMNTPFINPADYKLTLMYVR
jgi:hypothetical protein